MLKVLFLIPYTNNTVDQVRAMELVHDVQNRLDSVKFKEDIVFSSRWAVDHTNLQEILNQEEPDIIHIVSRQYHGEIALQVEKGRREISVFSMEKEVFGYILEMLNNKVRLLYLDLPGGGEIARYLQENVENVDYCIGMDYLLSSSTTRLFASAFYSNLGFGYPIAKAMGQAIASLLLCKNTEAVRAPFLVPNEMERLVDVQEKQKEDIIKLLFLHSNPPKTEQLAIPVEFDRIKRALEKTTLRDRIQVESRWNVQAAELIDYIGKSKPQLLHFSGHGTDDVEGSALVLEGYEKEVRYVTKQCVGMLCESLKDIVQIVFLNSCFSRECAEEAAKYVKAAIGMTVEVGDEAAIMFATQFYSSLGFGLSVKNAFLQAKLFLTIHKDFFDEGEIENAVLVTRKDVDPDQLYI